MFELLEATLSCLWLQRFGRERYGFKRPEVVHLPWSSFRPNKGHLRGWLEVVGYAARHCNVSQKIVIKNTINLFFSDWSVVFL